jgi:hypothetical protein
MLCRGKACENGGAQHVDVPCAATRQITLSIQ